MEPILSAEAVKRRKKNPTTKNLGFKSSQRRRNETDNAAKALHGASETNSFASMDGMIYTLLTKFPNQIC